MRVTRPKLPKTYEVQVVISEFANTDDVTLMWDGRKRYLGKLGYSDTGEVVAICDIDRTQLEFDKLDDAVQWLVGKWAICAGAGKKAYDPYRPYF